LCVGQQYCDLLMDWRSGGFKIIQEPEEVRRGLFVHRHGVAAAGR
jgi:hypothetical protein